VVATSWHPDSPGLNGSELAPWPSTKAEPASEMSAKLAIHPADYAHPVRKRAAAPQRNTRSVSATAKRLFLVSGLY
jgi:hypothetical protein